MTLEFLGTLRGLAYLAAGMLFILSLRGLSTQESARRGNLLGILGMTLAVVITAAVFYFNVTGGQGALSFDGAESSGTTAGLLAAALIGGGAIGALLAARVAMTSMPELVAVLHSFVGAAAVLVGIATYLQPTGSDAADRAAHQGEIYEGVLVGAVTFSGSIIAFGKLRGKIGSKPLLLPGRHALNVVILTLCVAGGVIFQRADGHDQ